MLMCIACHFVMKSTADCWFLRACRFTLWLMMCCYMLDICRSRVTACSVVGCPACHLYYSSQPACAFIPL